MNHGDKVQVVLVAFEDVPSGPRKNLVFHVVGTKRTVEHVFMENGTNPLQAKQIWAESLATQLGIPAPEVDLPSLKYLRYVEGLSEAQAKQKISKAAKPAAKAYDKFFEELVGKECNLWMKVNKRAKETYYNYVPYEIKIDPNQEASTELPYKA